MKTEFTLDELNLEGLEELSSDFPNLKDQLPLIEEAFRRKISMGPIIVPLLLPENNFAVFRCNPRVYGKYKFSHQLMYHGISVGHFHEEGDSFDDLEKVMSQGFSSDSEAGNVYVTVSGAWDPIFKPQRYMTPTRRDEIQGDKYLLLIRKAEVPSTESDLFSSISDSYDLLVHRASREDISVMVNFSYLYYNDPNPLDEVRSRMEFYLQRYPGKVGFYRGVDTFYRTLSPKDLGLEEKE